MGRRLDNARALYLEGIRDGDYVEAIERYAGDRYIQHSTPVRDGKEGFVEFFADFIARNPVRDIEIVRGFEDGRHVFLQAVQTLNHGEYRYVTADIFDTDDEGRLIEHWDMIAEMGDVTASGRGEVDGPTQVDPDAPTDENKATVARYVDEVLIPADFGRLGEFVHTDLAQHVAPIADGADGLRNHALATGLRYVERHNLIGSGDFVAVLAELERSGTRHAVIDLYRLADGRIAEAWAVGEEITPRATWVNGGKF